MRFLELFFVEIFLVSFKLLYVKMRSSNTMIQYLSLYEYSN